MQLFAERLRDNNAARFINSEADGHSGTSLWINPISNTIVPALSRTDPFRRVSNEWRLRIVKKTLIILAISGLAGLAFAQDTAKDDLKKSGQETKDAAKDVGKGVKKGTKRAVHKSAKATKKAASKVEDKTRQ
jgi:hypothetical protein